ncbi:MAG: T9SS type A sorting domain-containing protein [Lewinella sp.]|nr:T9SS type A sorting domain-containing protein [Lewinella sp.]
MTRSFTPIGHALSALLLVLGLFSANQLEATTCGNAEVIASLPFSGAPTCGGNDITSSNASNCYAGNASYFNGNEALFSFTPAANMTVNLAYSGQTWTQLSVYLGCPTTGGSCVAGNFSGTSSSNNVMATLTAGMTYFILIDTWPTPNSPCPGTLTVTEQVPVNNDDCLEATALTPAATCSYATFTTVGASDSGVPSPGCASYSGGDVWFSVVVPASGQITVDMEEGTMTDSGLAAYSGSCGSLSLIDCDDDGSDNGLMSSLSLTGLTPGETIYLRVWEYLNDNPGTFGICVTAPEPCTDNLVTVNLYDSYGDGWNGNTYEILDDMNNTVASGTLVDGFSGSDELCLPDGCYTMSVGGGNFQTEVGWEIVYDGNIILSGGAPVTDEGFGLNTTCDGPPACEDNVVTLNLYDSFGDGWNGNTYEILDDMNNTVASGTLVDGFSGSDELCLPDGCYTMSVGGGNYQTEVSWEIVYDGNIILSGGAPVTDVIFGINASCITVPDNDECAGAFAFPAIPVEGGCITMTGTTVGATQSQGGCAGTADDDVWFSFVASSESVAIELSTISGSFDRVHEVFSGACGNLTSLWCSDPESSTVGGLTIGETYFVRVYTYGSGSTTDFEICIEALPPPPVNDDCAGAIELTVTTSCSYATYSNLGATGSTGVPSPGCGSYSGGDVWFSAMVPDNGILVVDMIQGEMTDSGLAAYSGDCGSLSLIECDDDDSANGFMSSLSLTGLTPGEIIYLRVWEYGNDNQGTFGICVTSPEPLANDDCAGAIALNPGSSCSYASFTTFGATGSVGAPDPGCGNYSGGDVWFSVLVPASGALIIDTDDGGMTDSGMAAYSGDCGALTLIECDDDDSSNGFMSSLSLTGLTPGETIYLRVWEYGNDNPGTFGICVVEPPVNDDCAGALPISCGQTLSGNTAYASNGDAPGSCDGLTLGTAPGVWYVLPGTGDVVTITTDGSSFDTKLGVFTGACGALICEESDDDSGEGTRSSVTLCTEAGVDYYIYVTGYLSAAGAYDLTVSCSSTPPTITCQPITVEFNGQFAITPDAASMLTSYSDNCGSAPAAAYTVPATVNCTQVGAIVPVSVFAEDASGAASAPCATTVTVTGLACNWTEYEDHINCPGSSSTYNASEGTFTVTAADCSHSPYSNEEEAYAYLNISFCGDGEIIAYVEDLDGLGKAWAGIVMRESNDPGSKKFQLMTGLDYLQHRVDWRSSTGGFNQTQNFSRYGQHWLRIVRTGPIFQAYTSYNGFVWGQPVATQVIQMEECIEMGLVVTNVPFATNVTATFSHVSTNGEEDRPDAPESNGGVTSQQLEAFPNPTSGTVTLNLRGYLEQGATLEVVNTFGQLLEQRRLGVIEAATEAVDLSQQPAGVYLIRLRLDDGTTEHVQVVRQ